MNIWPLRKKLKFTLDMKLQSKLLISYLLLIVIPMCIFMYLSYDKVYAFIESVMKYSAEQSFHQTESFIAKKIQYAISVSDILIRDRKVQKLLSNESSSKNLYEQLGDYSEVMALQNMYSSFEDIYRIKYYVNDDKPYINDTRVIGLSAAKGTQWYKKLSESSSSMIFNYFDNKEVWNEEASIACLRFIKDENNYLQNIAVIRIDINQNDINKILEKSVSTPNSKSFIINQENTLFSISDKCKENINIELLNYSFYQGLIEKTPMFFDTYKIAGEQVLLGCTMIPRTDLILITIIPYNEILLGAKKLLEQIFLFMLILSGTAYFVAYIISTSIVKRVKKLIYNMKRLQNGEFGNAIEIKGNDEISELMQHYNYMSDKLSFMVKEQFRIGQEAKSYELKALQEQINPHFLYNTLDLINWTAINHNVPQISALVKALSRFYKLSLSKGSDIISVRDELEHVRLYMEIQNQRFENAFNFIIETDEKVYDFSTIKIILQPLVENSVLHGIMKKETKKGSIYLRALFENERIIFEIEDDGKGMEKEVMESLLSGNNSGSKGYGVRNINERIKLYYGEEYGLSYRSTLNKGTVVTVVIPAVRIL